MSRPNRRGFGRAERNPNVSRDAPERPPTVQFMAALSVARNAKIGIASGAAVAVLAYLYRILELVGPSADTRGSPLLFLTLALTLALAVAALVALALTLASAYRLARES